MYEVSNTVGHWRTYHNCWSNKNSCLGFSIWFSIAITLVLCLPCSVSSLSSDGQALLQIKSAISSDPLGLLSDWNAGDANPCSWTGVTCDHSFLRVTALNITGEVFCAGTASRTACSEGLCGPFESCPSLIWQTSDVQCSTDGVGIFSPTLGSAAVCLSNGTAVKSSANYDKQNRVPCRLLGSLSAAVGNLTFLRVLDLGFNALSGGLPKEIRNLKFLQVINLRTNFFSGRIPVEVGHLSNLQVLNLAFNAFTGEIPPEISSCGLLEIFDLSGNMLSGKIPTYVGDFPHLRTLRLSYNQLDGMIPDEIANSCGKLEQLHLEGNFLFGSIPSVLGNCTNLKSLVVSSNFLSAPIPAQLGRLSMLQTLDVSRNSLGGDIPPELGNCTNLSLLVLTNLVDVEACINRTMVDPVDGYTSKDKGEYNYFTGAVPASITSLPYLRVLWAPRAGFLASFPSEWGSCPSLEVLNLGGNSLSGSIPLGLTRCKQLIYFDVSCNSLGGSIPEQLSVSCMVVFNVSGNFLSGNVSLAPSNDCPNADLLREDFPDSILYMSLQQQHQNASVNIVSSYFMTLYYGSVTSNLSIGLGSQALVVIHDLSQNNFTGVLPSPPLGTGLSTSKPSYGYFLSSNQFHGTVPGYMFHNCDNFQEYALVLNENHLEGLMPASSMSTCQSLTHFEASDNQLSGSIPAGIGSLKHLAFLDLGFNNLAGLVPPQLGSLSSLEFLILRKNSLSGAIPVTLGNLNSLVVLDLSENKLSGEIPVELGKLHNLNYLWLNNNSLSGSIPESVGNIASIISFNVAYNNLSGTIPGTRTMESSCQAGYFAGNPFLQSCAALAPAPASEEIYMPHPMSMPPSGASTHRNSQLTWWMAMVIVAGSVVVLVPLFLLMCYCIRQRSLSHPQGNKEVVVFVNTGVRLTYENVVRATGNFCVDNLIGNGGFGATYKAEVAPGYLFAVKKLYIGRFQGVQQFVAEIRTLGRIRHPHLVTLVGYYASESEMFLIYNYLSGGNLETLLHSGDQARIPWKVRHKIALNVAQALNYLHNGSHTKVLHRDIKPSNILLDTSLNAYLSDFGLARLLGTSETHATTDVAGTFGYVAPEYALTGRVSDKADVYSYGVVLLELLSGKKALDPSFSDHGDGFNIVAWASHLHKRGRNEDIFAPGLWEQGPHSELVETLKLAIICTGESLAERPTMKRVVECLKLCRLTTSF